MATLYAVKRHRFFTFCSRPPGESFAAFLAASATFLSPPRLSCRLRGFPCHVFLEKPRTAFPCLHVFSVLELTNGFIAARLARVSRRLVPAMNPAMNPFVNLQLREPSHQSCKLSTQTTPNIQKHGVGRNQPITHQLASSPRWPRDRENRLATTSYGIERPAR